MTYGDQYRTPLRDADSVTEAAFTSVDHVDPVSTSPFGAAPAASAGSAWKLALDTRNSVRQHKF